MDGGSSSSDVRSQLGAIKFVSIVAIAFCHAPDFAINTLLFDVVTMHLTVSRLALIFVLSGFFLLRKDLACVDTYLLEVKKRIKSLLIPYFFWSILVLVLMLIATHLYSAQFSGKGYSIGDGGVNDCVRAILGVGRSPLHYQFGFLRNLFLLVLISPAMYWALRQLPIAGLLVFWLLGEMIPGAGYFYLGGLLWRFDMQKVFFSIKPTWMVVVSTCVAVLVTTLTIAVPEYLLKVNSFVFLISFATMIKVVFPNVIEALASFSFVVFALHEPTITIIGKVLSPYRAHVSDSALYMIAAFSTLVVCLGFGFCFKKMLPRLYSVAVGDR